MPDEEILLNLVPKDRAVGNVTLLHKLKEAGWDEKKYWTVREQLLKEGKLERGKGKALRDCREPARSRGRWPASGRSQAPI